MAVYSPGAPLQWREVGELPSACWSLVATKIGRDLYVTGGLQSGVGDLTSVLAWDAGEETWHEAGNLAVARHNHGAVAVPLGAVVCA